MNKDEQRTKKGLVMKIQEKDIRINGFNHKFIVGHGEEGPEFHTSLHSPELIKTIWADPLDRFIETTEYISEIYHQEIAKKAGIDVEKKGHVLGGGFARYIESEKTVQLEGESMQYGYISQEFLKEHFGEKRLLELYKKVWPEAENLKYSMG